MRKIIIRIVDDALDEFEKLNKLTYEEQCKGILNSENQQILKSINNKIELIRINPMYGSKVSKQLIKESRIPTDNLFVVDLTGYWRMLYTLQGNEIEIICFVLKIVDHDDYNKIFRYKKK
ncbi:MAG: hypothetical protein KJ697_01600 [Nanoarchaeota archaeon]|nr:hypothetical protein [Nanoarchaeota archaeon]